MHEYPTRRTVVVVAALLVLLGALAAFSLSLLSDDPEPPAKSEGVPFEELVPLSGAELNGALAVALEHGKAYGTFDPDAPPADYEKALTSDAASDFADVLGTTDSPAIPIRDRVSVKGGVFTGSASLVETRSIAPTEVTFAVELTAKSDSTEVDLGEYLISTREDDGAWAVTGISDLSRHDTLMESGEGHGE